MKKEITYINFVSLLHVSEPIKDWESVGLKKIREWMIKRQMNSDLAFQKILSFNKSIYDQTFTRVEFRKAM